MQQKQNLWGQSSRGDGFPPRISLPRSRFSAAKFFCDYSRLEAFAKASAFAKATADETRQSALSPFDFMNEKGEKKWTFEFSRADWCRYDPKKARDINDKMGDTPKSRERQAGTVPKSLRFAGTADMSLHLHIA